MTDLTFDPAALRALLDAATPGPWAHEHEGGHIVHGPEGTVAEADYAPDAKLIVALRNQGAALLDALAAAREELAAVRKIANDLMLWIPGHVHDEFLGRLNATKGAVPAAAPQAEEPTGWRPMTYAELIVDQRSHDMERGNDGIVHARSCWCAAVPGDGEQAAPAAPALALCQQMGTCCTTCMDDFGTCCTHDSGPVKATHPFTAGDTVGVCATCGTHVDEGFHHAAKEGDGEQPATTSPGWPKSQDCAIGACRPCDRDYCRCSCHDVTHAALPTSGQA